MAETTKKTPNLFQRINAVMQEVKWVEKKKNPGMQYATVSHDDVTGALHDAIVKHGIVYYPAAIEATQDGNRTQVKVVVRFVNIDNPEDSIAVESLGYGIDQQDKGPGKAISYAVKYALLKAFGLNTGDDPDNDQTVKHEPQSYESKYVETSQAPTASFADRPASEKQIGLIRYLAQQKGKSLAALEAKYGKAVDHFSMQDAKLAIDELKETEANQVSPEELPWEPN